MLSLKYTFLYNIYGKATMTNLNFLLIVIKTTRTFVGRRLWFSFILHIIYTFK